MDKRTILALVISALVILVWQGYMQKFYPQAQLAGTSDTGPAETGEAPPAAMPAKDSLAVAPSAENEMAALRQNTRPPKYSAVETDKYIVTLSDQGGSITSIVLKEYPEPATGAAFKLIDVSDAGQAIFAMKNVSGFDLSQASFEAERRGKELIFSTRLPNGLEISKKYTFYNSLYSIDLQIYFKNKTTKAFQTDYTIVASSNIDVAGKIDQRYTQIVSDIAGKVRRDSGKRGAGLFVDGVVNYTGTQNKYFSVIAQPTAPTMGAIFTQRENHNLISEIKMDRFIINPLSEVTHNFRLYAGPTKKEIMRDYQVSSAISYGFFGGISRFLVVGLKFFHRVFRNWGVAVILLAACVNLALFPLSRKSYASMKKMQELQPHMERLRGEHKDNPQKLNKEMMELYKKYNVNPMGGCLPLFLQMPIFIALYQALMRSLDLRGATFLWIKDLSMPDAVKLPFALPIVGNTLNILPILMAAAMVVQQKIAMRKGTSSSEQARQQQQMMMVMMPVLFLFIMYSFPSGLVLYWLTNTLLTMFEQRAIMRH